MLYLEQIPILEDESFGILRKFGHYIIKSPSYPEAVSHIKRDYEVNMHLYNKGISVPTPLDFFEAGTTKRVEGSNILFTEPSFVRAFIPGNRLSDMPTSPTRDRLMRVMLQELKKAKSCGYDPFAADAETGQNAIVIPNRKKVFLIDFGNWVQKN